MTIVFNIQVAPSPKLAPMRYPPPSLHFHRLSSSLRKQSLPWTRFGESKFIGTNWRKNLRKGQNIPGYLQPIEMDPGSSPRVTGTEGTRICPTPFRHSCESKACPGLD
jgi:hypothetical protein